MNRNGSLWTKLIGTALAMVLAAVAQAHHSFAMFDKSKIVSVTGVVRQIEWENPHVYLYVVGAAQTSHTQQWTLECSSVNLLVRAGWRYGDVKEGDRVSITFYPLRDGRPGGLLYTIVLPGGRHVKL